MHVGFVGLGLMGAPMAYNLVQAGFELTVWNRTKEKAKPVLARGARWADTVAELTKKCDVIITMVTNAQAVEGLICGPAGVLENAKSDLIIIDMSSIPPDVSRSIANQANGRGVEMLDAPVTGNPKVAEAGKLGIMVGGEVATLERVRPILDALSSMVVYAGRSGAGSTLKLVNNLILGVAIQAVAEALVLARKSGIDPQCVRQITSVGGARTGAMETRGQRMIDHDFSPHFTTDNMHKDLSTALKLADDLGASAPTAKVALEILATARAQKMGEIDSAVVYMIVEQMSGLVRPQGKS